MKEIQQYHKKEIERSKNKMLHAKKKAVKARKQVVDLFFVLAFSFMFLLHVWQSEETGLSFVFWC